MPWYAIRAVYGHGYEDNRRLYEERIMLFRTDTVEQAFALAQDDANRYLKLNPIFERVGNWTAFELGSETDLNGVEIWSELTSSELLPTEYYQARYTRFELEPDNSDDLKND